MGKIASAQERLLAEALILPAEDRLSLVQAIWKSVRADLKSSDFTAKQKAELDRRLAAVKRNPSAGASWEEVEARILRKG